MDLERLKALLEKQETFPHDFPVKFIGANTQVFRDSIHALEARYPSLNKQGERRSSGDQNLAPTYVFRAQTADEIIDLLKEIQSIPDLKLIL